MMAQPTTASAVKRPLALALCLSMALSFPSRVQAVSPESPEVRATVDKALKFLETNGDARLGGECLVALAFLKNDRDLKHPKIRAAIELCQKADVASQASVDNYSLGCALFFLCEADLQGQRQTIQRYVDALLKRQKANGGWGYHEGSHVGTGDNSQTQYAVLGLWMAHRSGFDIPLQAIERVTNYLMRVQDPSGGWGYQGVDPNSFNRVNQDQVTNSRTAAGLGSLYILGDLIVIPGRGDQDQEEKKKKLPPALVAVEKEEASATRRRSSIDTATYRRVIADGNRWFDKNLAIPAPEYNYYFMYGYERYRAYRELYELNFPEEPEWYTKGFEYLQKTQQPDGSWRDGSSDGAAVNTAFSVLFLSRSSRKSIANNVVDLGSGVLRGGLGLPLNTADIREVNGRLVDTPLSGSVDELLSLVDEENNPELAALADSSQAIRLDPEIKKRSGQLARLRALVRAESPDARLVAVRTLGTARDLDNVPPLLYALSDPEFRVVLEADKWLRFVSRRIDGVGLEPGATREQIKQAQRAWTDWYLSIRPDAELLE